MDIKKLKPSKHSRFKQGVVARNTLHKLFESQQDKPVIYRSSYEWRFINWLERNPHIVGWGSECLCIPYKLDNGENHSYYPDYVVKLDSGDIWVVEIKPANQTKKPSNQNSYAWTQWLKNKAKWKYALAYCNSHGYKFKIFTEDTIQRLG